MMLFHRHRYEIVDAQHHSLMIGGGPVTLVLSKCIVCGRLVTRQVPGHWSLVQLKSKSRRADTITEAPSTTEEP